MDRITAALRQLKLTREVAVACAVLVGLALLLAPLPGFVLDLLLAMNLASALGILLLAALAKSSSAFPSFPAEMMLASLGRVGLCVAGARALLTGGSAGALAASLGAQMTGGGAALLAGVTLVALLAIVVFLVINVGVMRLSEVAARFALDAMPGKQMALDSALNGGRLTAEAGLERARRLEAEQAFHGAMDGVARFLRGDAIAIVIVTVAAPLAAVATGMELQEALASALGQAALLLVSAILTGAAAALLLSRPAAADAEGDQPAGSGLKPALLGAVAVCLLATALLPGVSRVALLAVAALVGAGAWYLHRQGRQVSEGREEEFSQLQLRLGLSLIGLLPGQELTALVARTRAALADELGFAIPAFLITDDSELGSNDFAIRCGGTVLVRETLRPGRKLVAPLAEGVLPGGGTEAVLWEGLQATWLRESEVTALAPGGYHVLRPLEVLALWVRDAIHGHAAELFDLQRATEVLEVTRVTHPASVTAFERAGLTAADLREVGRRLLREGVPLTERVSLLEGLAAAATGRATDAGGLAEAVRPALAQTITRLVASTGAVEVLELGGELEQELLRACAAGEVTLAPQRVTVWSAMLRRAAERFSRPGQPAVILTNDRARPALAQLIRENGVALRAVQPAELLPMTEVQTISTIQLPVDERPVAPAMREGVS